MQTKRRLSIDRVHESSTEPGAQMAFDREAADLQCDLCKGPLADHVVADHASRVVERMLTIGCPTPVNSRLP